MGMHKISGRFALSLYNEFAPTDGNLFFSPYSITSAMGMAYAGARENTASEIAKVLEFAPTPEQLPAAFKALNAAVHANTRKGGHELNIANGLCLIAGDVSNEYKAILHDSFEAEVFRNGLDRINAWVRGKTEGKIEKILEELSPDSVCVLLNAIYFKGSWASQFKREATQDAPFRIATDKEVTVPLMYQKGEFKLLRKEAFQAIILPYSGNGLSMVIVLPRSVDGLDALEKSLTEQALSHLVEEVEKQVNRVTEVFVPRFKVETHCDLISPCQALGITDAFTDDRADFRGMGYAKGKLWIAQIKHSAFLEVNEEGIEAAAATAQTQIRLSVPGLFRADHPFLFVIRDHATGSILFVGRLSDPTMQRK